MTIKSGIINLEKRIVLTFDICSSTDILEDLIRTENIKTWRNFLVWLKEYLRKKSEELPFEIYKFTGDGWIILFNIDHSGFEIIKFLEELSKDFQIQFKTKVEDYLDSPPDVIGFTFGMDKGTLVKIIMSGRKEYIGRALNVACRLQSAIQDKDDKPQYKGLMTKHLYRAIQDELTEYKVVEVKRKLKNIAGDKVIRCIKILLKIKK